MMEYEARMKKLALFLSVLMVLGTGFAATAFADSAQTTYTATGTYADGTISTPLSGAGESFTIQFTLPIAVAPLVSDPWPGDDIYLTPMDVNFSMNGVNTLMTNTMLAFYRSTSGSQNGGFFVDWCATDVTCVTGLQYQWTFGGPQQYNGNELDPTLTPSSFNFTNQSFIIFSDTWTEYDSSISGSVVQRATSVPEPGVLFLLLAGFAGIALLMKMRG
jgi:hypothetical protein